MDGMEAIEAMMEGKTVVVTKGVSDVVEGIRYWINDHGILLMGNHGIPSPARMNAILASQFEVVPDYTLNFFEAMEALNEGKTVQNEAYKDTYYKKNEDGNIVYDNGTNDAYFTNEELKAKWKIVE